MTAEIYTSTTASRMVGLTKDTFVRQAKRLGIKPHVRGGNSRSTTWTLDSIKRIESGLAPSARKAATRRKAREAAEQAQMSLVAQKRTLTNATTRETYMGRPKAFNLREGSEYAFTLPSIIGNQPRIRNPLTGYWLDSHGYESSDD